MICFSFTGPSDYNESKGMEVPLSCCASAANISTSSGCTVHSASCEEKLQTYLRNTASLLAILGCCVLAFLKLCFLGILRYEIREMIQKIRILRAELELPGVNGAVPGASFSAGGLGGLVTSSSGGLLGAGCTTSSGNGLRGMAMDGAESERESLLIRPESAALLSSPPTQTKNPNGNNNYEMREYRRRDNI